MRGQPSSFYRYEQLKPKYGVFLEGFPAAVVTSHVTKNDRIFFSNNWFLIWYHGIVVK